MITMLFIPGNCMSQVQLQEYVDNFKTKFSSSKIFHDLNTKVYMHTRYRTRGIV